MEKIKLYLRYKYLQEKVLSEPKCGSINIESLNKQESIELHKKIYMRNIYAKECAELREQYQNTYYPDSKDSGHIYQIKKIKLIVKICEDDLHRLYKHYDSLCELKLIKSPTETFLPSNEETSKPILPIKKQHKELTLEEINSIHQEILKDYEIANQKLRDKYLTLLYKDHKEINDYVFEASLRIISAKKIHLLHKISLDQIYTLINSLSKSDTIFYDHVATDVVDYSIDYNKLIIPIAYYTYENVFARDVLYIFSNPYITIKTLIYEITSIIEQEHNIYLNPKDISFSDQLLDENQPCINISKSKYGGILLHDKLSGGVLNLNIYSCSMIKNNSTDIRYLNYVKQKRSRVNIDAIKKSKIHKHKEINTVTTNCYTK